MPGRIRSEQGVRKGASRKLDAALDKALAQTFPASDPVSVGHFTGTEPPSRPIDRNAPRMEPAPRRRRGKTDG
jgi:hypothetical protein